MRSGEVRRETSWRLRNWMKCREQGRWLLSKARLQTRLKVQAHNRHGGEKQLSSSPDRAAIQRVVRRGPQSLGHKVPLGFRG
jgi:hypothetical protein